MNETNRFSTNLVGRKALVDITRVIMNDCDKRFDGREVEIVAARLHSDNSGIVFTVLSQDGETTEMPLDFLRVYQKKE